MTHSKNFDPFKHWKCNDSWLDDDDDDVAGDEPPEHDLLPEPVLDENSPYL